MLKESWIVTVAAVVILLLGATAQAGSFSGTISATLTSTTSGACDESLICPSGDCTCLVYDGSVSGSVGKGTAEVDATEDNGLATIPGCTPFFSEVFISASKDPTKKLMGSALSAHRPRLRPTRNSAADSTSFRPTLAQLAGVCTPGHSLVRLIVWSSTTKAPIDSRLGEVAETARVYRRRRATRHAYRRTLDSGRSLGPSLEPRTQRRSKASDAIASLWLRRWLRARQIKASRRRLHCGDRV
jgi:hypothetical protein